MLRSGSYFYPRPPRGGRRVDLAAAIDRIHISIHALREEGDPRGAAALPQQRNFYPRPPRGGRPCLPCRFWTQRYFYPRPPRGGRRMPGLWYTQCAKISIHALREEGDYPVVCPRRQGGLFLSTPSARRATECRRNGAYQLRISIHALREEGDYPVVCPRRQGGLFLSTPSARRATAPTPHRARGRSISIHALREEGDVSGVMNTKLQHRKFLSTPSARRATAKTERTPSAFVLLYTSVHKLQRGICHTNRSTAPFLA